MGPSIGSPVTIAILENDYAIIWPISRHDMRIERAHGYPKSPVLVPIHSDRVCNHGVVGKEVDFKAFSQAKGCQFFGDLLDRGRQLSFVGV